MFRAKSSSARARRSSNPGAPKCCAAKSHRIPSRTPTDGTRIVSSLACSARHMNTTAAIPTSSDLCRRAPDGGMACFGGSPGGPPRDAVNALCIDRDGRLWAATFSGLWRISIDGAAPRLERVYGVADGLASARVHSLFQAAGGTLWVGTAAALSERTGERFRNYSAGEGLSGRAVLALNEDRDGNLWAGIDHGLARIARDGFATFTTAEGMGHRSVTELLESGGDLRSEEHTSELQSLRH